MKLSLLAYLLVLSLMLFMFTGIIYRMQSIHNEKKTNVGTASRCNKKNKQNRTKLLPVTQSPGKKI